MSVRVVFLAVVLITCFVLMSGISLADDFAGGDGSEADPFQIATPEQLQNIQNNLDSNFILINDIDLTGVDWLPIGVYDSQYNYFSGTLDGAGHTISGLNLTITTQKHNGTALFALSRYATFSNIVLTDMFVAGYGNVSVLSSNSVLTQFINCSAFGPVTVSARHMSAGVFASSASGCAFTNCSVSGPVTVTAAYRAGGFTGLISHSHLFDAGFTNCSISGDVTITAIGWDAGGFAGYAENVKLNGSSVSGAVTVTCSELAGGLLGRATGVEINRCSVQQGVTVTGPVAGGLVGRTITGSITPGNTINNCYSEATVEGKIVGGLVGTSGTGAKIIHSYFAGVIEPTNVYLAGVIDPTNGFETSGGLYGGIYNNGVAPDIVDSFYLITEEGYDVSGGTAISAEDMMRIETFTLPLGEGGFLEGDEPWNISTERETNHVWVITPGVFPGILTYDEYPITYVDSLAGAVVGGQTNVATYNVTSTVVLSNLEKADYAFCGWYDDPWFTGDAVPGFGPDQTGEKTFYAKWDATVADPDEFEITYVEGMDGTGVVGGVSNPETYNVTSTVVLSDLEKAGHTFNGWYANEEFTGGAISTFGPGASGAKTFYAKWGDGTTIPDEYTIIYVDDMSGTVVGGGSNPAAYNVTSTVVLFDLEIEGHTFNGWYDNEEFTGGAISLFGPGAVNDKTFYAKWTEIRNDGSGSGGGSGFGEAEVIDAPEGNHDSSASGYAVSGVSSDLSGTVSSDGVGAVGHEVVKEDADYYRILYLLLFFGFLLLFFIILFLIKRRKDDNEEDLNQI